MEPRSESSELRMSAHRLHIIIFGATGFTGKRAVQEMCRLGEKYQVTWGVAGRSESKLQAMLDEVSKKTGEDLSGIRIILADICDHKSLQAMCQQTRVLVNCCGPYRLYGEPVVRAAVEMQTNYVDVSGEPQFIESMQLKYDRRARESGVFIVSACGLDSVPNDIGVVFLRNNFHGILNSVESYMSTSLPKQYRDAAKSGVIHYGTWESLVHSLANWGELRSLREKMYPQPLPTFKPKLKRRFIIHPYESGWCLPFPGADASIVYRTQRYLYETLDARPVQFKPYFMFPNVFLAVLMVLGAGFLYLMCLTKYTRNLLLKHPRLFSAGLVSREGPKDVVMDNTEFRVELVGRGWDPRQDPHHAPPARTVKAIVTGTNPGYGATSVMLLLCAITMVKERENMPHFGGVFTTGLAFKDTKLVKRLSDNGVLFQIKNCPPAPQPQ